MGVNSINTNAAALVALQSFNRTSQELNAVQKAVSTGFRINDAIDNGAAFAVAQSIRSDVGATTAVNQQLNIARGLVGVALEAATSISNSLVTARQTITFLADESLSADQRSQYQADLSRLVLEITNFRDNATFNENNLLEDGASDLAVIANVDGDTLSITGTGIADADIDAIFDSAGTASDYVSILGTEFVTLESAVLNALNSLGGDSRRLNNQINFNTAIASANEQALGALVDADLARESSRLTALQTRQQLGTQTLGIANQSPSVLLGLFR